MHPFIPNLLTSTFNIPDLHHVVLQKAPNPYKPEVKVNRWSVKVGLKLAVCSESSAFCACYAMMYECHLQTAYQEDLASKAMLGTTSKRLSLTWVINEAKHDNTESQRRHEFIFYMVSIAVWMMSKMAMWKDFHIVEISMRCIWQGSN